MNTSDTLAALVSQVADAIAERVNAPDALVVLPDVLEQAACMRLVREGALPACKIGRKWYARRSDVLALVEKLRPIAKPRGLDDVAEHVKQIAEKMRHGKAPNRHRRAAA